MYDFWLGPACLIILRGEAFGHSGRKKQQQKKNMHVIQIIQVMVMQPLNILLTKESAIKLRVGICSFWSSVISGTDL